MRYLKTYAIFESVSDMIFPELKDICLDLEDDGYYAFVWGARHMTQEDVKRGFIIGIRRYTDTDIIDKFNAKEVIEVVLRMSKFLKTEGYEISSINVDADVYLKTSTHSHFKPLSLDEFIRYSNDDVFKRATYVNIAVKKINETH